MLKRVALIAAALILAAGTVAAAAGAMGVTINGKPVTFKTAPQMQNNTLMVPLEEVAGALGIEAKWNLNTNTLEITDARAHQIEELQAKVKELEAKAGTAAAPTVQQPAGPVTKDNLVATLQARFGSFKSGSKEMHVTWSKNPYSDPKEPMFTADIAAGDFGTFRDIKGENMLKWFDDAAKLIAQVYPNASALLSYANTFSTFPGYDFDKIELTDDWKYRVLDYEIWSFIEKGQTATDWD